MVILHSYEIPIPMAEMSLDMKPGKSDEFEREANERIAHLKERIPGLQTVEVTYKTEMALLAEAVRNAVESEETDMIIMGTKGSSGLVDFLIGSNAADVVKITECPVIVAPQSFNEFRLRHIVFATDFLKINDHSVLQILVSLARIFDAEIEILNVDEQNTMVIEDVEEAREASELHNFFKDVKHTYRFSANKNVVEGIIEYAASHDTDLLAIMPRKHKLFSRVFNKNVTKKLAHKTEVPMLAFKE